MSSHDDVTGATPSGGATNGAERFKPPAGWTRPGQASGSSDGDSAADAQASQAAVTARYTTMPATPPGYSFQRSADAPETGAGSGAGHRAASSAPYSASAPASSAGYGTASGSPYSASAPASSAGYRASSSAPYSASAPASSAGYGSGPSAGVVSGPAPSASAPAGDGSPPSTPSSDSSKSSDGGKRRRGPGWGGVLTTAVVVALLASGGTVAGLHYFDYFGEKAQPAASAVPTSVATGATTQIVTSAGTAPDWESVTNAVANSVVAITVKTAEGTEMGSGVIYDDSGHIITNHHVVGTASQIQVTLADGRIYDAELTGTDPATDLAVVQIEGAPDDLTVAQIGDSDQVVTGQDVMAIGNPLGLSSTVTTGIVSAINRPVVTEQKDQPDQSQNQGGSPGGSGTPGLGGVLQPSQQPSTKTCTNAIQIDAAINPGNSGGPLFDETGKLIGITSSIATLGSSTSGSSASGSIGIGFAIPGNLAVKVADQLIKTGTATHAFLGVALDNGSEKADGETRAGAKVTTVEPDSPAAKAGIEVGDVITAIDGKTTNQPAALTGFVRQYSAGDTVKLTVIRNGEKKEIEVTLVERKDS